MEDIRHISYVFVVESLMYVITCRNTSYHGLLGKTMESKCEIKDQNMYLLLQIYNIKRMHLT